MKNRSLRFYTGRIVGGRCHRRVLIALWLFCQAVGGGSSALALELEVETRASKKESSLPVEIARFDPPADLQRGEPPFIYAVSARPMGIVTFPQYAVDNDPSTSWSAKDPELQRRRLAAGTFVRLEKEKFRCSSVG